MKKARILARLKPGAFARDVGILTGGTGLGQLVLIAALPILTRLYTPGEFGAAAVFAAIVGIIVVVATLRFELALPLARSDRAALQVAVLALVALTGCAIAAGLALQWWSPWLEGQTGLAGWIVSALVFIGIVTSGSYQIANYWAVRKSGFRTIALTRIQQGIGGAGSQLLLGLAGLGAFGLIAGQIVGQCAGLARLASAMLADIRKAGFRVTRRRLGWAAKRYRRFPIYDSWAGLLNTGGSQAPVLLFAALFSPLLAGYYALATRVLLAPMGLVGRSVSQVLLPRVVEANRRGDAGALIARLLNVLATLALVPFAVVAVVSADIVPILFGQEWAPAATVFAWTAAWAGWQFVCSPLSVTLIAVEAQKLNAILQFMLLALRIGALLWGTIMDSAEIAVVAFSLVSIAGYGIYIVAIGRVVGLSFTRTVLSIWMPAVLGGMCLLAAAMPAGMTAAKYATLGLIGGLWMWLCLRETLRYSDLPINIAGRKCRNPS